MFHEPRCKSVRKVFIKDKKELDYYQPGKVFRNKNITSSYKVDTHELIQRREGTEELNNNVQAGSTLVYFYIYSQLGKFINNFFPPKYLEENQDMEQTIVFMAGTEFLVCKREEQYDYKTDSIILHIYLREVQIGFGEQIFLWCEDKIYDNWQQGGFDYIRRLQPEIFEHNVKFIFKNNSQITMSYFRSEFFRISLAICKSFKVIQNKTRVMDDDVLFTWMEPLDGNKFYFAGLRFLENLYRELDDMYPDTKKIKMMIFSGKVSQTRGTFEQYMKEYATMDLLLINKWHPTQPILLTDKVDETFEGFTSPSQASQLD